MMEKTLEQIAERILSLDEASLTRILPEYKKKMEAFEPTPEWEKSIIIFFLINAVRVKNSLFNENVLKENRKKSKNPEDRPLKLVK
jgi:hypothetical protein